MSTELIRNVQILPDGVYLTSKSNNDSLPFNTWRCDSLSNVYAAEGQLGLDREIVHMLFEYARLSGDSLSNRRYRYAMDSAKQSGIYQRYLDTHEEHFRVLTGKDIESFHLQGPDMTDAAKAFRDWARQMRQQMYTEVAGYCKLYDELHPRRIKGRYPMALDQSHPDIVATFIEDYDPYNRNNPPYPRYKKGDSVRLSWFQAPGKSGWYSEFKNGVYPIPAKDFNQVLTYEVIHNT